jgi:hypothetical protein
LVRLDEDGYDIEESGKRKRYRSLKDVSVSVLTHKSLGLTCHSSFQMWGTKEYFAPEVVNQAYGPQADVWALG